MAYLFDTDAISEVLKPRPALAYIAWLSEISREDQFASAVSLGELYQGAYRSQAKARHLTNIRERVVPALTVLPFDADVARVFGEMSALLEQRGQRLADADSQIAATALHHGLVLVTGNLRHFERVPGLPLGRALADARGAP